MKRSGMLAVISAAGLAGVEIDGDLARRRSSAGRLAEGRGGVDGAHGAVGGGLDDRRWRALWIRGVDVGRPPGRRRRGGRCTRTCTSRPPSTSQLGFQRRCSSSARPVSAAAGGQAGARGPARASGAVSARVGPLARGRRGAARLGSAGGQRRRGRGWRGLGGRGLAGAAWRRGLRRGLARARASARRGFGGGGGRGGGSAAAARAAAGPARRGASAAGVGAGSSAVCVVGRLARPGARSAVGRVGDDGHRHRPSRPSGRGVRQEIMQRRGDGRRAGRREPTSAGETSARVAAPAGSAARRSCAVVAAGRRAAGVGDQVDRGEARGGQRRHHLGDDLIGAPCRRRGHRSAGRSRRRPWPAARGARLANGDRGPRR